MEGKTRDVRLASCPGHGLVHGFDDIAANRELAQRVFETRLQRPAGWGHRFGKAEPLQLCGPGDHQDPQFRVLPRSAGPKIDNPGTCIRDIAERTVEIGPALSLHLPFQGRAGFPFAPWAELQRDPLSGTLPKPLADVGAADHQILAVVGTSTDENMDVRIVSIPVIDCDPIEPGAEIAFGVGHQLTGEGAQTFQFGCVLG
jgi:hypothetical protein